MNGRLFIVERPVGPAWIAGRGPRGQRLWPEHAAFMDGLFDEGRIVLAGPLVDGSGAVIVMEASDEDEVRSLLADDPWVVEDDIMGVGAVREWQLYLDRTRELLAS